MKTKAIIAAATALATAGWWGCTENMNYTPGGTGAAGMTPRLPANNYYAELSSKGGVTLIFAWDPGTAEDGQLPMYEVAFYTSPTGGREVYRISAGSGSTVAIGHKEINKAASAAGVDVGQEGTVYWGVIASRGANESASAARNRITVKRLFGFNVIPANVYITGSGSETGEDLSKALRFKPAGEDGGEFEIFTELGAGSYSFVDGRGGTVRRFGVSGTELVESDAPTAVASPGIYRIVLDFNTRNVSMQQISNMRYVMCIKKNVICALEYRGNGYWRSENFTVNFNDGWDDDRYFFRCLTDGADTKVGARNPDFGGSPGSGYTGPQFYTYFGQPEGNPDWDYSFKAISSYRGATTKKVNVNLYLSGELDNYYHLIEYLDQ
ncbi:MAG: SusE domain-containing protein [Rikenellaceae bacterium]|jgi:hypothetical protein|nr:SusE domain-containing protein [Rikenellaceae bacterium]